MKKRKELSRTEKIINMLKKMFGVNIFDTETTGLNNDIIYVNGYPINISDKSIPEIIELAFIHFNKKGDFKFYEDIAKPQNTIVGVIPAATHGYTNKMLMKAKKLEDTKTDKAFRKSVKSGDFVIAHNMPFDEQLVRLHGVDMPRKQLIDTVRVAKHCYKNGLTNLQDTFYKDLEGTKPENHQLQYFRYLYEMDDQEYFTEGMKMCGLTEIKPHTALSDVFVLWIFTAMLMVDFDLTLEDMVELTNKPVLEEKFLYSMKDKIRDLTYDEIIYNDTLTPWGAKQPGYDSIMWVFEDAGMSVDTEYSFIYNMGKAILKGRIPFAKGKKYDYTQFLYYAIKYCFNKDEITEALLILGKDSSFIPFMLNNMEKKVEAANKETLPTDIDPMKKSKWISKRENRVFLHNYTQMFRMDILSQFK